MVAGSNPVRRTKHKALQTYHLQGFVVLYKNTYSSTMVYASNGDDRNDDSSKDDVHGVNGLSLHYRGHQNFH